MDPKMAVSALGLLVVIAGCLGPEGVPPVADAAIAPEGLAAADPVINVLTWEGHVAVSAAAEPPAHLRDTEALVEPVWDSGFNLQVEELPEVVEIRLDWTSATPSRAMFMAHVADDPEDHRSWVEFEYPAHHATSPQDWPTEGPLCMRLTTEDLAPGHWHIMAHTAYGSDIQLTFTITTVGGVASIPDGLHGHEADTREAEEAVELYAEEPHAWTPCELSGDDVVP